jgi:hypothetical protein
MYLHLSLNVAYAPTHLSLNAAVYVPTHLSLNVVYASVNVEDVDSHKEIAESTYAKQNHSWEVLASQTSND